MSTCGSRLQAVDHANSRYSNGYKSTGVGAVICARHSLVRKSGVADLQRGERYVNMDYILLSTLSTGKVSQLLIIYDIACQWSRRFLDRTVEFPPSMQLRVDPRNITYAIPKGHIQSHGKDCQSTFSLNFLTGSGRTDGEGVERDWAHMNGLVPSTREMNAGNRHETLDDHWGYWNWEKIKKFGEWQIFIFCHWSQLATDEFFLRKLREALLNHQIQHEQHEELSSSIPEANLHAWDVEIEEWNEDHGKPNPYDESNNGNTAPSADPCCTLTE